MTSERVTAQIEVGKRAEAEAWAHDRVSPDAALDSISAVNLYEEAFLEGTRHATDRREAAR